MSDADLWHDPPPEQDPVKARIAELRAVVDEGIVRFKRWERAKAAEGRGREASPPAVQGPVA